MKNRLLRKSRTRRSLAQARYRRRFPLASQRLELRALLSAAPLTSSGDEIFAQQDDAILSYRLEVTDVGGTPISSLPVGGDFLLRAYVEDIRDVPQGAFTAYMNVAFDPLIVDAENSITYHAPYTVSQDGTVNPGLLENIGAQSAQTIPPPGGGEFLVFTVPFTATAPGTAQFSGSLATDQLFRITTVFGGPVVALTEDEVLFLDTSLEVVGPPGVIIEDASVLEGDSGTTDLAFTVSLTESSNETITVDYNTSAGTATEGVDYNGTSGTLTFEPGQTTQTIVVQVVGERVHEADETFTVELSNPTNALLESATGTGTIVNDDPQPTISIAGNQIEEEDAGVTPLTFLVSLSNASHQTITVEYETAPDTATADGDYVSSTGSITFEPGQISQVITIDVVGDTRFEDDETFFVNLLNPTSATIAVDQAVGTILNDDDPPAISIDGGSVTEGDAGLTPLTFTVTLSGESDLPVTVEYATAPNTATADEDYVSTSGTLQFLPGETVKTITVDVVGDTISEADETFFVDLSNPTNATIATGQGIGAILDDEPLPSLSIGDASVVEGDGGVTLMQFIVTLANPSGQPVTVDYATSDITATETEDYMPVAGTLTFAPGETEQAVTVEVLGDDKFELDETFLVTLSNPTGAVLVTAEATGTIIDDDVEPTITIAHNQIAEGDSGNTPLHFLVSLSNPSYQTITIEYQTAPDTATAGVDYVTASGTVTFQPGQISQPVTINVMGDTDFETDETFFVDLSNPSNATIEAGRAIGTILNDDQEPMLSIGDATVVEGDAGTTTMLFTVTLSNASVFPVSVAYDTSPGTATPGVDYLAASGTVDFQPGETERLIAIEVVGDTLSEADETFFVNLSAPTGGTIDVGTATGTIVDDDPLPLISVADASVVEGDAGVTHLAFTVSLSVESGQVVSAQFATSDVTALAGIDYAATSGTVTFQPGETSQTIAIEVFGDTVFEPDETFQFTLSDPLGATIDDGQAIGTIVNDDPIPSISIANVSQTEGDSGTTSMVFTVSLSNASSEVITVDYSTAPGTATAGADYQSTSGTLTFEPGATTATLNVSIVGDALFEEDETFFVNLTNADNATIGLDQAIGTILNDDAIPAITIADASATEGDNGTTPLTFTVTLSAPSGLPVAVEFATAPGTATAGTDYTSSSGSLLFEPGETTKTITIDVIGDTIPEEDETFFVNLSGVEGAILEREQAVGTVVDDDFPSISIADASAFEGNSGLRSIQFLVTLSEGSPRTVTVAYATAPGTATANVDYESGSGTVTFEPGETQKFVTVQIIGDTLHEADETFLVNLSSPTNATIDDAEAVGTIIDDDAAPSISINNPSVAEGNSGTAPLVFTVTLSAPSGLPVSVQYATADGTATVADDDYLSTSGTLTFAPGQTVRTITVGVVGDTQHEEDETFFLTLSEPTGATLADTEGVGTILNDDEIPSPFVPGSIAGYVYVDVNNNGLKDARERALGGVTITLNGTDDFGAAIHAVVRTDYDGSYRFENLNPGTYTVTQTQPAFFLNGHNTPGNGAQVTSNSPDQFTIRIDSETDSTNNNFAEWGLRPEFISKRLYHSSLPSDGVFQNLDLSAGPLWFAFDTGWTGLLSAEAQSVNGAPVSITLYNENLQELMGSSPLSNGSSRIHWLGDNSQAYFMKVSGVKALIDLHLLNPGPGVNFALAAQVYSAISSAEGPTAPPGTTSSPSAATSAATQSVSVTTAAPSIPSAAAFASGGPLSAANFDRNVLPFDNDGNPLPTLANAQVHDLALDELNRFVGPKRPDSALLQAWSQHRAWQEATTDDDAEEEEALDAVWETYEGASLYGTPRDE